MSNIQSCSYRDCYYNNNLENSCVVDKITVSQTGICENLTHCDEYVCSDCGQFDICEKQKKRQYLADE